jgi:hypothetical protein
MESLMREAVAMRRNLFGSENREVADSLMLLTAVLRRLDKLAEAEAAIDEAIAIRSKLNGYDHIPNGWPPGRIGERYSSLKEG